ncbi:hypothetical protein NW067_02520 [Mycoplasmopsis cynos]|nr:hypothetical protein [Mycoplasmopsis cynos]UWV83125.1 hypothetical protein NW067_02520 [Mycoplasmopsis cynos]
MLAGISEVLELLEEVSDTSKYTIRYLPDGSIINNLDIVLELEGHYQDFGIWEGMIDGILARNTSIATNAWKCKLANRWQRSYFYGRSCWSLYKSRNRWKSNSDCWNKISFYWSSKISK